MERREAEKRVEDLLGWYVHLTVYGAVVVLLTTINTLTWRGVPWALFAAFGWGIGLGAHALRVGTLRLGGLERWREAKTDEFMRESS